MQREILKKSRRPKQISLIKKAPRACGGTLRRKLKGRGVRTLGGKRSSMHVVLKSSRATGELSFRHKQREIRGILDKFAEKYLVQVLGFANVGNHLHLHLRLNLVSNWSPFIRAISSAIRIAVTGNPRWRKHALNLKKFWDYRPYTVLIQAYEHFKNQARYILINQLQGDGYPRPFAETLAKSTRISSA